jgi:2-methylcitrate dehydratase PrpD
MASLSRQLAQWVAALRYENLPAEVVDRAKGVTLQGLASVLLGSLTPGGRQAVALMTAEEAGVKNGATIMVDGTRVTKGGAAFANAEMAMAGGKWDTFRMLTHPGTSIIPGAFVAAEASGASGAISSPASRRATR